MMKKRTRDFELDEDLLRLVKRVKIAEPEKAQLPTDVLLSILELRAKQSLDERLEYHKIDAVKFYSVIRTHEALLGGSFLLSCWYGHQGGWARAPTRQMCIYVRRDNRRDLIHAISALFDYTPSNNKWTFHPVHTKTAQLKATLQISPELCIRVDAVDCNTLFELRDWHATQAHALRPVGWVSWSALTMSPDRVQLYSPDYSARFLLTRLCEPYMWFNPRFAWSDRLPQLTVAQHRPAKQQMIDMFGHQNGVRVCHPESAVLLAERKVWAERYLSPERAKKWWLRGLKIWKMGGFPVADPNRRGSWPVPGQFEICFTWTPPKYRVVKFASVWHMLAAACDILRFDDACKLQQFLNPQGFDQDEFDRRYTWCRSDYETPHCSVGLPSCTLLHCAKVQISGVSFHFEKGHFAHGVVFTQSHNNGLYHKLEWEHPLYNNIQHARSYYSPTEKSITAVLPWNMNVEECWALLDDQDKNRLFYKRGWRRHFLPCFTSVMVLEAMCATAEEAPDGYVSIEALYTRFPLWYQGTINGIVREIFRLQRTFPGILALHDRRI